MTGPLRIRGDILADRLEHLSRVVPAAFTPVHTDAVEHFQGDEREAREHE